MVHFLSRVIAVFLVINLSVSADGYKKKQLTAKRPPLQRRMLKHGLYIPEFFFAGTKNARRNPIIIGPTSPCCAVFVARKGSRELFGAHVHSQNADHAIINAINNYFHVGKDEKPEFIVAIFTVQGEIVTHYFKEGSHKKRVLALRKKLIQRYNVINIDTYFTQPTDSPTSDRWPICYGLDVNHKLILKMADMSYVQAAGTRRKFNAYTGQSLQSKVGLERLMVQNKNSIWYSYENPLYKLPDKTNIASIQKLWLPTTSL